ELLSFRPLTDIRGLQEEVAAGANPRDVKYQLAHEIVERFHSPSDAAKAHQSFVNQFQRGEVPDDIAEVDIDNQGKDMPVANVIKSAGLVGSTSEVYRLMAQGAVRIDGERVTDHKLTIKFGVSTLFQVGKRRFARIRVI
ncbi:MAG: S4 domain-containing protein, partial [Pseudomonadota bacterium]|nr:S4 domain-containing protein [Pseudomonadota bacterium]